MAQASRHKAQNSPAARRKHYNAVYISVAMLIMNATDLLSVLYLAR